MIVEKNVKNAFLNLKNLAWFSSLSLLAPDPYVKENTFGVEGRVNGSVGLIKGEDGPAWVDFLDARLYLDLNVSVVQVGTGGAIYGGCCSPRHQAHYL